MSQAYRHDGNRDRSQAYQREGLSGSLAGISAREVVRFACRYISTRAHQLGSSTVPAAGSYKGQSSPLYTVDTAGKAVEVGCSAAGRAARSSRDQLQAEQQRSSVVLQAEQ